MLSLLWKFRDAIYISILGVLMFLLTRSRPCPQVAVVKYDTLRIYDTIYMGSAFSLSAARCESLNVKANTRLQRSFLWAQTPADHIPAPSVYAPPRWSVGVGVLYPLKPYGVVEYYPRPHIGIGIYVEPTQPRRIGTHVKVRF